VFKKKLGLDFLFASSFCIISYSFTFGFARIAIRLLVATTYWVILLGAKAIIVGFTAVVFFTL
jgi:hypothetical protein